MPFRIPDAIKTFDFRLSEAGLPLAKVILLGGVRYVEVCPACSCIHELPMRHEGDTYEPRCLWREWGSAEYLKWTAKYPQAAEHRKIALVDAETFAALVPPPLSLVAKPKRTRKAKTAAPVKRPRTRKAA